MSPRGLRERIDGARTERSGDALGNTRGSRGNMRTITHRDAGGG